MKKYRIISLVCVSVFISVTHLMAKDGSYCHQNLINSYGLTNNVAEMPTLNLLSVLYESLGKDNSSQLFAQNGFQLLDKKSKKEESDPEFEEQYSYTVYKYTYKIKYDLVNGEGYMNVECVFSPTYGEPSMTIRCDNTTWEDMKGKAKKRLKTFFSENNYFLGDYYFIDFENKGVITITGENSISWGQE